MYLNVWRRIENLKIIIIITGEIFFWEGIITLKLNLIFNDIQDKNEN